MTPSRGTNGYIQVGPFRFPVYLPVDEPPEPALRVVFDAVGIGGLDWQLRSILEQMEDVSDWYFQHFNISLNFRRIRKHVGNHRMDQSTVDHSDVIRNGVLKPCLWFCNVERFSDGSLGQAQGELATIAWGYQERYHMTIHEVGHLFGLGHKAGTFMDPAIELFGEVTKEQRASARDRVLAEGLNG